jgi:hypothetical protein
MLMEATTRGIRLEVSDGGVSGVLGPCWELAYVASSSLEGLLLVVDWLSSSHSDSLSSG